MGSCRLYFSHPRPFFYLLRSRSPHLWRFSVRFLSFMRDLKHDLCCQTRQQTLKELYYFIALWSIYCLHKNISCYHFWFKLFIWNIHHFRLKIYFLDTEISAENGCMVTEFFYKSTDSVIYFVYVSSLKLLYKRLSWMFIHVANNVYIFCPFLFI